MFPRNERYFIKPHFITGLVVRLQVYSPNLFILMGSLSILCTCGLETLFVVTELAVCMSLRSCWVMLLTPGSSPSVSLFAQVALVMCLQVHSAGLSTLVVYIPMFSPVQLRIGSFTVLKNELLESLYDRLLLDPLVRDLSSLLSTSSSRTLCSSTPVSGLLAATAGGLRRSVTFRGGSPLSATSYVSPFVYPSTIH